MMLVVWVKGLVWIDKIGDRCYRGISLAFVSPETARKVGVYKFKYKVCFCLRCKWHWPGELFLVVLRVTT